METNAGDGVGGFRALRIDQRAGRVEAHLTRVGLAQLSPGAVLIRVGYSTINYKDALAASADGRILRRFPLIGGIDLAGVVESSDDPAYRRGDPVLVMAAGLSETRDGGYAHYARVPAEAVVPIPNGLDAASAMALGTAGAAAALAIMRLEHNGQRRVQGPIVVTGATGGVGSIAIDLLAGAGYEVVAITGKYQAEAYLRALGAERVLLRDELTLGTKALESAIWGGAIDNIGGPMLSWLLRSTREHGNVASIGLAASPELHTSVMPFILRGVNLLGINVGVPRVQLLEIWRRLATDLKPRHLDRIVTRTVGLDDLPAAFEDYLAGRVIGRTLVRIGAN